MMLMSLKQKMLNQQENKKACPHKSRLFICSLSGTAVRSGHVFQVII